jgi:hypothetical protein
LKLSNYKRDPLDDDFARQSDVSSFAAIEHAYEDMDKFDRRFK